MKKRNSNYLIWVIFISISLFTNNCATLGRKYKSDDVPNIKLNQTTKTQIEIWFGEPFHIFTKTSSELDSDIYEWFFEDGYKLRSLSIEFYNDSVKGYIFISSFDDDSTKFVGNLRKEIKVGITKKDDVIAILGQPSGKLILPTNLLNFKFRDILDVKPNKNLYDAGIYCYLKKYRESPSLSLRTLIRYHVKAFAIYFDRQGKVVDISYFEGIPK